MIPAKYAQIVFSFFMALLMSCFMSLAISIFNVGLTDGIVQIWLNAWLFAFSLAFPFILILSPTVKKLVTLLVKSE